MKWSLHIVLPFYFRLLVTFLSIYFHQKNKKRKEKDIKKDIHVYNNIIYFFFLTEVKRYDSDGFNHLVMERNKTGLYPDCT